MWQDDPDPDQPVIGERADDDPGATFRLDMLSTIGGDPPGYCCLAIDERGVRRQPTL